MVPDGENSHESSFLHAGLSAAEKLERARTELLDLSARNRLLNIPRSAKSARTIEVVDEKTPEVFRILVTENRAFTFLPGRAAAAGTGAEIGDEPDEISDLAQPDDSVNERGVFNRHVDTKLQTKLTSKGLQKKLLELYFDSRTLEEEQGVNILFLALGTLKWVDPTNAKNIRYAPLILIPVTLERGNAAEQFKLKWRQEDPASNLSLEAYLDRVHSLKLPPFEASEEVDTVAYINAIGDAVSSKLDWCINPDDIVLGFFSFSKFLMYRDLDPSAWPAEAGLINQPLINGLLKDGFGSHAPLLSDEESIDVHIQPSDLLHIVDCDSSQALAVHDVRAGQNLVIQGPPGTGKSQTIANVIASAVADGKTVLFVAEKMAALEVVKRRLDAAGVGDACLELHSNKANKRILLEELKRTSNLGAPRGDFESTLNSRLTEARNALNLHASRLHRVHSNAQLTPYQVIGELTRLRQDQFQPVDIRLSSPESWTPDERKFREGLIGELAQRIVEIGIPGDHPWSGVGLTAMLPTDVERLVRRIDDLKTSLDAVHTSRSTLSQSLGLDVPGRLGDIADVLKRARRVFEAPPLTSSALVAQCWSTEHERINQLIEAGVKWKNLELGLLGILKPQAWSTDVASLLTDFQRLSGSFSLSTFAAANQLQAAFPTLLDEANRLLRSLGGSETPDSIAFLSKKILMAERVAAAPNVSPDIFAATVWDQGVELAADLVVAISDWGKVRAEIEDQILDIAFDMDFSDARRTLAQHGNSMFRFLNGDWRKARSLVKSILKAPDTPLVTQLALLDKLAKGQKARAWIQKNEDIGSAAFGADWRGERSSVAPLLALVEWMRSLKGLGAEPRLLAQRLPDRSAIGARAEHVRHLIQDVYGLCQGIWNSVGSERSQLFPGALSVEEAPLEVMVRHVGHLAAMSSKCSDIFSRLPGEVREITSILDQLIKAQSVKKSLDEGRSLGATAFDTAWLDQESDWTTLAVASKWVGENIEVLQVVASHDDRAAPLVSALSIEKDVRCLVDDMDRLFVDLSSNAGTLFGMELTQDVPVAQLDVRLGSWIEFSEQLSTWVAYRDRADKAMASGLGDIVVGMERGAIQVSAARKTFDMAYYEALFRDQVAAEPDLARFDGKMHSRLVSDFSVLDRERIAASSLEVVHAHYRRIPQGGGGAGPLGVLRGEMARRRGHMPIRQLMLKAAPAIQALKPVLMMSPLSVAQFLPPGQLQFDLLVMDEASQIQPVDALGAIARCRQVVVVGDERQLPPTKFFSKMTGGSQDDEEVDEAQVSDIESILGLFSARGLPQRMLRWHYRSRHQSLIAVSNSQFYENKLFIVPSPYTKEAGMGLQFSHIAEGVFDSGNTGTNEVEAKAVAGAIIQHARLNPELSLGVATFSVKQRKAIQDQLELLRRGSPETEAFFNLHPNEPFFVKNLENVQGDERDVIFISVGYARNPQGYLAMRFGPLSAEGGERRLNVLISRAKRRCEVFSSITDEDIDLERGKGKGVYAFKLFLHYARTGRLAMAQPTDRQYESPFEVQVAKALQAHGCQVHPQVGIAGFFIDLAIADADRPGRYILGIECDGKTYHESRSARDRDRLRQAVLEDHGWIIHRIWSTDWFNRPKDELQRVLAAIEAAREELDARMELSSKKNRAVPITIVSIDRGDVSEIGLIPVSESDTGRIAYAEAKLVPPAGGYELHETPIGLLAELIKEVVAVESPVHADEIVVRLRSAWGLKRAGGRIQAAVERGLELALQGKGILIEDRFVSMDRAPIVVRDRSGVLSEALRKPEMLPPKEIDIAIYGVVAKNFGASTEEITVAVSRSLGFKATSSQLRELILARVDGMVDKAALLRRGDNLVLGEILN
jgi:very-short-patch-repair endonuclease